MISARGQRAQERTLSLSPHRSAKVDPSSLISGISSSTGLQLSSSARYSSAPSFLSGLDALTDEPPFHKGDVLELQGVTGSGKTTLAIYLTMTAILPSRIGQVQVGGKGEMVAFLDCTLRFDIRKLALMLRNHLVNVLGPVQELEREVEACLKRFVLFEPKSTLELAATVQRLPQWYMDHGSDELGYVFIDGMSEFAWADHFATERLPKEAQLNAPPTPAHSLRLLVAAIARLRSSLSPVIFITQWVFRAEKVIRYSSSTSEGDSKGLPFYAPHLSPAQWPSIDRVSPATSDPLAPPSLIPGTQLPSFAFHYHIACYPPAPRPMRNGITMREALDSRMDGQGEGTEGFRCVLRKNGGRELGMWEWEITKHGSVVA